MKAIRKRRQLKIDKGIEREKEILLKIKDNLIYLKLLIKLFQHFKNKLIYKIE